VSVVEGLWIGFAIGAVVGCALTIVIVHALSELVKRPGKY
jgi:hypothetical protein